MGTNPTTSVTDTNGRFHHVANAYCADQSLFLTVGSVNPTLTALTLARKVAQAWSHAQLGLRLHHELIASTAVWNRGYSRHYELPIGGFIYPRRMIRYTKPKRPPRPKVPEAVHVQPVCGGEDRIRTGV